jgi:hypothetical protein
VACRRANVTSATAGKSLRGKPPVQPTQFARERFSRHLSMACARNCEGACRNETFFNGESITYRLCRLCKSLILRSTKSISDRLLLCPQATNSSTVRTPSASGQSWPSPLRSTNTTGPSRYQPRDARSMSSYFVDTTARFVSMAIPDFSRRKPYTF